MDDNEIKEKMEKKAEELQNHVAKLIANATGVPVLVIKKEEVEQFTELVKKDKDINKYLNDVEIEKEASNFYSNLKAIPPKNKEDLKKKVEGFLNDLKTEKEYTALILLEGLIDLPIGIKLGELEIIPPDLTKKEFQEHLNYLKEKQKLNVENCSWAKIIFKSYKTQNIREILFEKLELPFGMLSLIMNKDVDVRDIIGIIYSSNKRIYYLQPSENYSGWSVYRKDIFEKPLEKLSNISQKNIPTDLEKKILQAIQIFWLSRLSYKIEIRFLMIVSALESLLLTEKDRDYIGLKLSEKTAFLIENEPKRRYELFKIMKKFYTKRSKLVHAGKKDVEKKDLAIIENIFLNLTLKLLELSQKYTKMEQKSHEQDQEGVEDYIEFLKFNL